MSITDELRGFAHSGMSAMECSAYSDKLIDIADRIDAAVKGMVELPKDADDVPWNVGDLDEDGNEVIALKLAPVGWYVNTVGKWPYRPDSHRHYHAQTVEDVLEEMLDALGELPSNATNEAIVAEYAAKLKLAEGENE